MERTSLARRLVAITATAVLGLAGALALAPPASAQTPTVDATVDATFDCDELTGEYLITWTVASSRDEITGTLTSVTFDPTIAPGLSSGIVSGATLPSAQGGPLQAEQRVPGDTTTAFLAVTVAWTDEGQTSTATASHRITLAGDCVKSPGSEVPGINATAFWEFDCEVFTFWVVNESDQEFTLTLEPSAGDPEPLTVPADGESDRVEFTASEGLVIEVFFEGQDEPATFEDEDGSPQSPRITSAHWDDLGCEDDGGAGGELPATGTETGLLVVVGFLLLALGGALLLISPRPQATSPA